MKNQRDSFRVSMHLFFPSILLLAAVSFADDAAKPDSKTGVWVGKSTPGVQVKVDTVSHGVSVTLNKDKDQILKSIGITFFDANGNRTALELKAADPWSEPGINPDLSQTHFTGSLSPAAQSFVGFEIQIPFGSDSPSIIRSEDLKKSN